MKAKCKIKKGDTVEVITGEYVNTRGKVLSVNPSKKRAVVQGVALVKRHMKARSQQEPAGIIEKEGSIDISNLKVVCKKCDVPVRTAYKFLEDNSKVRYCKKCSEIIQ